MIKSINITVVLAAFAAALCANPAYAVPVHCIGFDGLNARHLVTDDFEVGKVDEANSHTLKPYEEAWHIWLKQNVSADFSPNQLQCRHFRGDKTRLDADRDFFRNYKGSYRYVEIRWTPPAGLTPIFLPRN